jgi:NitT/TauT family transport system ATP-binding protein
MEPKILLMDEPFGALDPSTRENMQLFLLQLWEELGMTVFFVTHDLEEAVFLGTRIFVLSQYYSDDRGPGEQDRRGAKIVFDTALPREAQSTSVKSSAGFADLIAQIRKAGFEPQYLQHVRDFNLTHPDSFRTINGGEQGPGRQETG